MTDLERAERFRIQANVLEEKLDSLAARMKADADLVQSDTTWHDFHAVRQQLQMTMVMCLNWAAEAMKAVEEFRKFKEAMKLVEDENE